MTLIIVDVSEKHIHRNFYMADWVNNFTPGETSKGDRMVVVVVHASSSQSTLGLEAVCIYLVSACLVFELSMILKLFETSVNIIERTTYWLPLLITNTGWMTRDIPPTHTHTCRHSIAGNTRNWLFLTQKSVFVNEFVLLPIWTYRHSSKFSLIKVLIGCR